MTMQYLCGLHCQLVRQDRERALELWREAFDCGVEAYRSGRWIEARELLGTAYEIGLLRFALDVQHKGCSLSGSRFAAVGRYYSELLCRLEDFRAAESCLRRVHDALLYWSEEKCLPYPERVAAFDQLAEFRQKLVDLLELTHTNDVTAKCTNLIAHQLAKQAAANLYH